MHALLFGLFGPSTLSGDGDEAPRIDAPNKRGEREGPSGQHAHLRIIQGRMRQLFVRHTRTHTIDWPSDDVDALLVAAAAKAGVSLDAAWLSYGGRVLRSGRSLRSYGLAAGATVHLAVRGRGGVATFRMHGAYVRSSVRQDSARAESSHPTAVPSQPPPQPSPPLDDQLAKGPPLTDVMQALTSLDDRLVAVLEREDIRLVRCEWLEGQPPDFKMPMRQELEKLEEEGVAPSPLLSGVEAVRLIREANRSVGVMSHPWLSPGKIHPLFSHPLFSQRIPSEYVSRESGPCGGAAQALEARAGGASSSRGLLLRVSLTPLSHRGSSTPSPPIHTP